MNIVDHYRVQSCKITENIFSTTFCFMFDIKFLTYIPVFVKSTIFWSMFFNYSSVSRKSHITNPHFWPIFLNKFVNVIFGNSFFLKKDIQKILLKHVNQLFFLKMYLYFHYKIGLINYYHILQQQRKIKLSNAFISVL